MLRHWSGEVKTIQPQFHNWQLRTYIDPDGNTPDDNHFMIACAGLCHQKTRCFVTFEDRGSVLRDSFLAAAHTKFQYVKQIPRTCLPQGYQLDHIDVWELRLISADVS